MYAGNQLDGRYTFEHNTTGTSRPTSPNGSPNPILLGRLAGSGPGTGTATFSAGFAVIGTQIAPRD